MIYKDNFERSADCVQSEEDRMVPLAGILIVDSIISRLDHKSVVVVYDTIMHPPALPPAHLTGPGAKLNIKLNSSHLEMELY